MTLVEVGVHANMVRFVASSQRAVQLLHDVMHHATVR